MRNRHLNIYRNLSPSASSLPFFYRFYYLLKPVLPRRMQIHLRRVLAQFLLSRHTVDWPIDESTAWKPERWEGWPEGKKFCLVVTHDVEKESGVQKVLPLMELDKSFGLLSSFNFVADDYPIDPILRGTLKKNGFEVGVHGLHHNHSMYRSEIAFKRQAERINLTIKDWGALGFRSPAMFHNLDWNHHLNILYDCSTFDVDPFEPQQDGQKTIFPFLVPKKDLSGKAYVELPYTLPQDHTLFVILKEKSPAIWKRKLDWIAQHGGMAMVIVHPDYIHFGEGSPGFQEYPVGYYREFLAYLRERYEGQYWNALPKEVANFWMEGHRPLGVVKSQHELGSINPI